MKRFARVVGCLSLALLPTLGAVARAAPPARPLPAFPGAEGFGAYTPGGRGGAVIHVTNLNTSGPGSLQEACSTPGPRVVVFDVSGVIPGDVVITEPHITIAGQTAPGAGVTINGMLCTKYTMDNPVHDVIVRYLRVRAKPNRGETGDAVQFSIVDNAVLDHLSLAWAEDETIDLFTRATNVTVQWCTLEESAVTGHPKGRHNFGLISGPDSGRLSIHHNLFAHHSRRNPAVGNGPVDFRNNVVYDFRDGLCHEGNYTGRPGFDLIGNYYKRGPSDPDIFPFCFEGKTPYYLRANYIEGVGLIQDPWQEAGKLRGLEYYADKGTKQEQETPMPPVFTSSALRAYRDVLGLAGCFPRDAVTTRTVREVEQGTGSWGRHDPNSLLEGLAPGAPLKDTDRDGMPDTWERAHRTDPRRNDAARVMRSGYTAIEEYVNSLPRAARLVAGLVAGERK